MITRFTTNKTIKIMAIMAGLFLMAQAYAWSGDSINVKVKEAFVYGTLVTSNYTGSLKNFSESEYFDTEHSSGEFEFSVERNSAHLSNAKNIARYIWKYLTRNATVREPYPCGYALTGTINEDGLKNNSGIYIHFLIDGTGDGGYNSCIGSGGPGWWSYKITVTFDHTTKGGTVKYELGEE